jgi:hypothetical protein
MADTASTVVDTMDPTIAKAMDQLYSGVMGGMIQAHADGVQMARKSYARLESMNDFGAWQSQLSFLTANRLADLCDEILGERSVQGQPQVGSVFATPTYPGGGGLPQTAKAAGQVQSGQAA